MPGKLMEKVFSPRILDDKGRGVLGARLCTFAHDTETPFPLFEDATLTSAHPWPLLTDRDGCYPEFFTGTGRFDMMVEGPKGDIMATYGPLDGGHDC